MSQQPPFQRPGGQAWNGPQGGGQPPYGQPPLPGQPPYAQPPPYPQQPQYPLLQPQYQQRYSQPPPGYYPPQAPPPKKRRSPLAIIGMVIGGVFVLVLIIGIIGAATSEGKSATATPKGPSSQVVTLTSTLAAPTAPPQPATVTPVAAASRPTTAPATAPTATAQPATVPPTAAPQPLKLVASGFGQTGQQVGVGFVVQNPDSARSLVLSQYQIAAYDANGVVLKTDSGYIEVALPGQSIGIGRSLYLAEGQTATKVDVQVKPGTLSDKKYPPAFTTEKVTIQPGDTYSISTGHATGIMKSTAPQDVKEVEADVVLYDGAGKIIGGGFTYVDFIPANGQAAVEMSLTYAGKPANAAMYGRLSGLSGL